MHAARGSIEWIGTDSFDVIAIAINFAGVMRGSGPWQAARIARARVETARGEDQMKFLRDGKVVAEGGIFAPVCGFRCDEIVLNARDVRRMIEALHSSSKVEREALERVMSESWLTRFTPEKIGEG